MGTLSTVVLWPLREILQSEMLSCVNKANQTQKVWNWVGLRVVAWFHQYSMIMFCMIFIFSIIVDFKMLEMVLFCRESNGDDSYPGFSGNSATTTSSGGSSRSGDDDNIYGMIFGGGAPTRAPSSIPLSLIIILVLYTITYHGALLPSMQLLIQ